MKQEPVTQFAEIERLHAALAHAETVVDALRVSRDKEVRAALAAGASVSAVARLVGLSRQAIMHIRDLNDPEGAYEAHKAAEDLSQMLGDALYEEEHPPPKTGPLL